MADNVQITEGAGKTIAGDDIGGVVHQRVKITTGADGVNDGDVSSSNPLPVSAASLPLPSGAATSAKQDTIIASEASIDSKTPALGQALSAASTPVVLPASQITTLTPPAAITNYANETGGNLASVKTNTDNLVTIKTNQTDKSQFTKLTDGTDTALVTGSGELNVLATAQPGTDIGDVTINNGSGASAVNIQDGGNSITVDGSLTVSQGTPSSLNAVVYGYDGAGNPAISTTNTGAVNVTDNGGSLTVDNGGTFAVQAAQSGTWNINSVSGTISLPTGAATAANQSTANTSLSNIDSDTSAIQTSVELIDDAIKADDAAFTPATTKVMMAGFEYDDDAPDSVDEGDAGAARMSANRNIYTTIRDAAGNERGANVNSSSQLSVSVDNTVTVGSHAVTNAGTFVVQENGAALTALQLIDDVVYTDDTSTHSTGSSKGALFMAAATPTDGSVNANDIGAVAMTTDRKLHVSVQDALPAGTNAIGKLSANSGVDIGDVDVTSAVITGGGVAHDGAASAVNPLLIGGYASAAAPADVSADTDSVRSWHLRNGAQATVLTAAGALIGGDASNGLDVDVTRMPATFAEDAAHTTGDLGIQILTKRTDSAATSAGTDGDYATLNTDNTGRVWVRVGATDTLTPGTAAANLGKAEDAVHSSGDTGVFGLAVANEAQTSLAADGDYIGHATDTKGNALVVGNIAHDGVDAGAPIKFGGKALDVGTTPTAVAANDRTNATFLRNGVQLVLGGDANIISKNLNVTDADGAQTDTALVTVSAGTAIVVTKVSVMVDSATTATGGVAVRIGFGTANVPAVDSNGIILAHPGIAAGSGVVEGNGAGIIGIGASNEDLRVTCEDPVGGNIDIIVTYFTIAIG